MTRNVYSSFLYSNLLPPQQLQLHCGIQERKAGRCKQTYNLVSFEIHFKILQLKSMQKSIIKVILKVKK